MGKARVLSMAGALGLAIGVGSCAAPPPGTPGPPTPAPAAAAPTPVPPTPAPAPPRISQAPRSGIDGCGAVALKYLVGRPRTEIPIPLEPGRRRVLCATCPIEHDYDSRRQTILYDERTGVVTSVTCG